MKKIILCGANGKMGHVIRNIVAADNECEIVAGVDINTESTDFPIYSEIDSVKESADVIIDFSNPALLNSLLEYSAAKKFRLLSQQRDLTMIKKSRLKTLPRKTACSSPIT